MPPILRIFRPEREGKLRGSGSTRLTADGARLIRALVHFRPRHQPRHIPQKSWLRHGPPRRVSRARASYEVSRSMLTNTTLDALWMIPTGEVPLTGMHKGEMFEPGKCQSATWPTQSVSDARRVRRERTPAGSSEHEFHRANSAQSHPGHDRKIRGPASRRETSAANAQLT